jgi:hypothetical protein
MATQSVTAVDVRRARQIWEEYSRSHDVTPLEEQTAGIEPNSGRVWFGDSPIEVHEKMVADGFDVPAYFIRVGHDAYGRKGAMQ